MRRTAASFQGWKSRVHLTPFARIVPAVFMPITPTAASRRTQTVNSVPEPTRERVTRYALASTRLGLGAIFLWAFLDKAFGLVCATPPERAWINGGSPTRGFLGASYSWFPEIFNAMAGKVVVDWLFMIGLLAIGAAFLLGIGMRVAAASGVVLMTLMWLAAVPGASGITNPAIDDHVIHALVLVALAAFGAGKTLGFGRPWGQSEARGALPRPEVDPPRRGRSHAPPLLTTDALGAVVSGS